MDQDSLIDADLLLRTFLAESREGLAAMERAALLLEREGAGEALAELFRAAHTLKGNARSLGYDELGSMAHALEDRLDEVRSGRMAVSAALVTAVLGAIDELGKLVDEIEHGKSVSAEQRTLRVEVGKLDRLLDLSGEIAVARGKLAALAQTDALRDACSELERLGRDLHAEVLAARAVPLLPALEVHHRTVRDAAAANGKQARLVVEAAALEVDTTVVEMLRDPLSHLVRNAVAHGLERAADRLTAGKEACGVVTLRARREGSTLVLQVTDDGRGFDLRKIARKAGLTGRSEDEILQAVFAAGFTTADEVSAIAGRGVGLDVVRVGVEKMRGSVSIDNREGQGATITLRLPMSMSILEAFFVEAGAEPFALPIDSVLECVDGVDCAPGRSGVAMVRGGSVPWIRLSEKFGLARGANASSRESLLVVRHGKARAGLIVDTLRGEAQTVVKPLAPLLSSARGVVGTAILDSGRLALVLDPSALFEQKGA